MEKPLSHGGILDWGHPPWAEIPATLLDPRLMEREV